MYAFGHNSISGYNFTPHSTLLSSL